MLNRVDQPGYGDYAWVMESTGESILYTEAKASNALVKPASDEATATDEALMERLCRGDQAAYRLLLERHLPAINRFSRRLLATADAEDVTQETFLRLWLHPSRWKPGSGKLTTWLHTIARNLAIDLLRKRAPQKDPDQELQDINEPDKSNTTADIGQRVQEAMGQLPERQRSALTLCHYQGFSNRETAAILGIQVDALESLLARARRRLRKLLTADPAQG